MIHVDMKRLLAFINTFFAYSFLADPAYAADTVISICPKNSTFYSLCKSITTGDIGPLIQNVVVILLIIAVVIALFFLIWGGIKWILSGGDKSAVEAARGTIVAAVVGLIVAFLAFFILVIVGRIFGINILELKIPTIFNG